MPPGGHYFFCLLSQCRPTLCLKNSLCFKSFTFVLKNTRVKINDISVREIKKSLTIQPCGRKWFFTQPSWRIFCSRMRGLDGSDIILYNTLFGVICLRHLVTTKLQKTCCMTFFWFLWNQCYKKSKTFVKCKTIICLRTWI